MHGSHLILQADNPQEEDIRFAAMLAAYHSSGKDSSSIPVNYCPVKNLKKIPGGKTGMVTMSSYKTIYIDITPDEFQSTSFFPTLLESAVIITEPEDSIIFFTSEASLE